MQSQIPEQDYNLDTTCPAFDLGCILTLLAIKPSEQTATMEPLYRKNPYVLYELLRYTCTTPFTKVDDNLIISYSATEPLAMWGF